jgi:hypothetical protein
VDKLKVQHEDQVDNIDKFIRPWEELQFKSKLFQLYSHLGDNRIVFVSANNAYVNSVNREILAWFPSSRKALIFFFFFIM